MVEQLKAKMSVESVTKTAYLAEISKLRAVATSDPNNENYSYSKATPQATLEMHVTNPEAHGFFEPGAEYVVTFERAEKPQPQPES